MQRPDREENANVATHALGVILSLAGCVILGTRLGPENDPVLNVACWVYCVSLVAVYTCSTLSHLFRDEDRQRLFRQLDQAFIFVLIVASYTPFSLAWLHGAWWNSVLVLMWLIAIVGFVSKMFFGYQVQNVSVWGYLALGWIPAVSGMPLANQISGEVVLWIVYGGVAYSMGTVFLFQDSKVWYFHAVWHLFVVAGSMIHFIAIMRFVV